MKRLALSLAASALAIFFAMGTAHAQPATGTVGSGGAGLGFGAAKFIGDVQGLEVAYDQPMWHLEGILGFDSNDNGGAADTTDTQFGVRGWYHLKQSLNADFSLGGGIGFIHHSIQGGPSSNRTFFEPALQVRVFLTPSVAIFGSGGLTIRLADNDDQVALRGQLLGDFGFTYYFR